MSPASIARPTWGPTSPWVAHQLSALTLRWRRGSLSTCDHRLPGGDQRAFTLLVPTIGAVACDEGLCASGLMLRLAGRLARAVPCDGCGCIGECKPAFVTTLNPHWTLMAGLCPACLANGPAGGPGTRSLAWATGSAWVASRTHSELLAWAQNRLRTCPHRRINALALESTVFDCASSAVRCPECQAAEPHDGGRTELCEGCAAAEGLFTAALSHAETPEYTLLVPLCGQCAQNGPVSAP